MCGATEWASCVRCMHRSPWSARLAATLPRLRGARPITSCSALLHALRHWMHARPPQLWDSRPVPLRRPPPSNGHMHSSGFRASPSALPALPCLTWTGGALIRAGIWASGGTHWHAPRWGAKCWKPKRSPLQHGAQTHSKPGTVPVPPAGTTPTATALGRQAPPRSCGSSCWAAARPPAWLPQLPAPQAPLAAARPRRLPRQWR